MAGGWGSVGSNKVTLLDFHCSDQSFSLIKAVRNAKLRLDLSRGGKVHSPRTAGRSAVI